MKLNTAPGETWIVLSTGGCTVTTGAGKQIKKLAAGQDFFTAMTGETIISDDNAIATVAKGEMLALLNLDGSGSGSDVQATLRFQPVTSQSALPATGEDGVIYLVPNGAEAPNQYTEWVWTGAAYEQLGDAGVDLSGYASKADLGITGIVDEGSGPVVTSEATLVTTKAAYANDVVATGGAVVTNHIKVTATVPGVTDPDTLDGVDITGNGSNELVIPSAVVNLQDSSLKVDSLSGKEGSLGTLSADQITVMQTLYLGYTGEYLLQGNGKGLLNEISVVNALLLGSDYSLDSAGNGRLHTVEVQDSIRVGTGNNSYYLDSYGTGRLENLTVVQSLTFGDGNYYLDNTGYGNLEGLTVMGHLELGDPNNGYRFNGITGTARLNIVSIVDSLQLGTNNSYFLNSEGHGGLLNLTVIESLQLGDSSEYYVKRDSGSLHALTVVTTLQLGPSDQFILSSEGSARLNSIAVMGELLLGDGLDGCGLNGMGDARLRNVSVMGELLLGDAGNYYVRQDGAGRLSGLSIIGALNFDENSSIEGPGWPNIVETYIAPHLPIAEHIADTDIHVTKAEHQHLIRLINTFPTVTPDTPGTVTPEIPAEALSNSFFTDYFSLHAQPGVTQAPGHVFVSRVPFAWWDEANSRWQNTASAVDETAYSASRKFMDNAGLQHTCSTDTVEGVDDYVGKHWAFFWGRCNYVRDEYGVKHITAVQGTSVEGHTFSDARNVGSFGPAFWFFCKTERYVDGEGQYTTNDGTADGTPVFQLWGISDRSWENLDDSRRAELEAHGITADDFHIWPECLVWDAVNEKLVERPYWVHSAYCGGYELDANGATALVSKPNKPLWPNMSYQVLNSKYGYAPGGGGSGCINAFGMLMDIIKNADKNSQNLHRGMSDNNCSAVKAAVSTGEPGYLFPIASKGAFEAGCTVWLWQTANGSGSLTVTQGLTCQIGRIQTIETRSLLLADGTTVEQLCLVIDPATVQPFMACTGADNAAAIAAAKALSDAGQYACCFATQGQAMSGETDAVLGKHDGSCTSNTNGRHPYRVQGTEYMPGAFICAADVVCCLGNGTQEVTLNGEVLVPTSDQRVYLIAPPPVKRLSSGNLASFLAAGYVPAGVGTNTGGYILNVQLDPVWGIAYPLHAGGTGSSSSTGHADNFWTSTQNPSEFLSGGNLSDGVDAGSACLSVRVALSNARWGIAGRD